MNQYHEPLLPGNTYHLFNRAVGSERLFRNDSNYRYFLMKMQFHLLPVLDVYAYALLPNHFHLLIYIKEEKELLSRFIDQKGTPADIDRFNASVFVMKQISNWLNGYAKAYNKMYKRMGSLFIDYTKRSVVNKQSDLLSFAFYIHKNAVHHGITKSIGDWKYDSYNDYFFERNSFIKKDVVLKSFGSKEKFVLFHQQEVRPRTADR